MSFLAGFTLIGALFLLPVLLGALEPRGTQRGLLLSAAIALLTVLATYMLFALYCYITYGINRLMLVTERVSAGELVNSHDAGGGSYSKSDTARLWASILKMNDRLGEIVLQVRSSAERIVLGARDIAQGNHHLAQRTQEQAAALEQTASGMEELAATAQQNASDCAQAATLAGGAREIAGKAASQMQHLAATMQQIDDDARRVADILATIEGIAFQSNLLALNAAVEAARAGDQGRGFAVVAAEVRSLSQRSAAAAREIKELVANSVDSVERGRKLAGSAEATMMEVVDSFNGVSDVISGISRVSAEQRAGIQAISQAMVQIDSANQQNAALVEEASAATDSFEEESARLLEVVSRFKTDRGADRGKAVAMVKAAAAHLRKVGRDRACADFNNKNGRFVDGEYYIFALEQDGTRLSYAPDPSLVGTKSLHLRDADGRLYARDIIEMACKHGAGWTDFQILNPTTKRPEPKSAYVELVEGVVLGCGIYRGVEEAASAERTASARPLRAPAAVSLPRLGTRAR